jgi:two-component system CheB/CheR fusion protein
VAIGASAGGLAALKSMLPRLPFNRGVAYLLAQHMDPSQPSLLDQILQRNSRLQVKAATDGARIGADCLYIIPPDQDGTVVEGTIRLTPSEHPAGPRHTVDTLFASVARAYAERSIGVVLSGSGSDGLQGIRAIKAAEGCAVVQDPASADFTGMPDAVIHERLADIIAPPQRIGEELSRLLEWPAVAPLPAATNADTLQALVRALVRKTGVALDQYKETTLRRRIERRRIVTKQPDLAAYLRLVEESETEANLLLQDMLISVTDFFRDANTFEAIRAAIRSMLASKEAGESIRIWIAGCATGEEAFSVAMLLADELGDARKTADVQIFATDIDDRAIAVARRGTYLKASMAAVPPALIAKYCVSTDGSYQIAAGIREMVTFAKHDLMQDPPFTRLDFVSCRNVLIYFRRPAQERLIGTFHYILNSSGFLVLGPSENTSNLAELFDPIDPKSKVFVRRELEATPPALLRTKSAATKTTASPGPIAPGQPQEQRLRDLIFEQYAPPSVLVDQRFNVLHTHGDTRRFLRIPDGNISINIMDMTAASLRVELRLVLQKSEREHSMVRSRPIVLRDERGRLSVTLIAIPLGAPRPNNNQTLLLFESRPLQAQADEPLPDDRVSFRILELEQDLSATRDHLQTNIEELEASNEELQSLNEEYQSTTEELQSANEELQTSNEEMQSTNEELSTVNEELRVRSEELADANRDLESILNSAVSGIVVLDNDLRVTRYSAASRRIFDLLPTSIGKPLISVAGIDLTLLSNDIQRALHSGVPVERELELGDQAFLVRLIPQQDAEDASGLVISFIDVTESILAARESRRLAAVLRDSTDAITVQRRDGSIIAWNRGAERMYGYTEAEALAMKIDAIMPPPERPKWRALVDRLYAGEHPHSIEGLRLNRDGEEIETSIVLTALVDESGKPYAIATTERDITLIREAEAQRRQAEIALEARLTTAGEMAAGLAHELSQPVTSVVHFCDVALSIAKAFDPQRRDELIEVLTDATAQSHRAGEIIRNLRRFLGRPETVRSAQQLNAIIQDAARFIRTDCRKHSAKLILDLADPLPDVVVDNTQIGQVLVNLVKNSLDAMLHANSEPRRITIRTGLVEAHGVRSVQTTVQDTGPGLDQEQAERLFEPFRTHKPNGLGMGLWISRSIVESHGGRLWADKSNVGGAAFHFSLPVADDEE